MERCRFLTQAADAKAVRKGDGEIVVEDDFADVFSQLSWHLGMEK